jgi:ADP-ribosyl-[dinitrogen reductase] hydrolase
MTPDVTGQAIANTPARMAVPQPLPLPELRDRAAGALVGLAVGDALGASLDLTDRDERPWHTEMAGGGVHRLPPGAWTDDTALALCLADSLIEHQQLGADDFMRKACMWWFSGANNSVGYCFEIDETVMLALLRFLRRGDAFVGEREEDKATGSVLSRAAPIAIFRQGHPDAARNEVCTQACLTHDTPLCLEASELFVTLLVEALDGASKLEILRPRGWLGEGAMALLAGGSWKMKQRAQVRARSNVLDVLEAALWALEDAGSFEDALVRAVNLGGPACLIGAVAGQLAGAIWGLSAIPQRWLEPLFQREEIEQRAYALLDAGAANRAFERHGCVLAARKGRRPSASRQGWLPLGPA